jgi:hypothetical protein
MKKLNEIKRGNDNRYFVNKDNTISFPLNLEEIDYQTPISLSEGTYAERIGHFEYEPFNGVPLHELVKQGELTEYKYVKSFQVNLPKFEHCGIHPTKLPYKDIIEEFEKQGFKVTRKAIKHNYEAWLVDTKSGYRDEKNNVFVFTPCGVNPLSFDVTNLDEHFDWQETYGAENLW